MDTTKFILENCKCCISQRPLKDSKYVNVVFLNFYCTWVYPYQSNLLIPGSPRQAVAYIHDDYVVAGKEFIAAENVKFAIEMKDQQIIYHPVEDLEPIIYSSKI